MVPVDYLSRISPCMPWVARGRGRPLLVSQRHIATVPYHSQLPSPPPREFNPDGTPKVYRLNQLTYDHKYDWERWSFQPVGVFHSVYRGSFAKDTRPIQ